MLKRIILSLLFAIILLSPNRARAENLITYLWSGTISGPATDPLGLDGKPFTVSATVSDEAVDNAAAIDVASFVATEATVLFDGVAVDAVNSATLRFTDNTSATLTDSSTVPSVDRISLEVNVDFGGFTFTFTPIATLTDDSWSFTQAEEALPVIPSGTIDYSVTSFASGYGFSTTAGSPYTVTQVNKTVLELIEDLGDYVESINLAHRIDHFLDAKLNAAALAWVYLKHGCKRRIVIRQLRCFIRVVKWQKGVRIPVEDANFLIQEARFIIFVIKNS